MATTQQQVPVQAQPQAAVAGNTSLYVGDLDPEVNEAVLFEEFSKIGQVASVRVCRDMHTKRSLGYAYVNYVDHQHADVAFNSMNFKEIKGRPCRIMWSQRDPGLRKSGLGNLFVKGLDTSIDNKSLYDTFSRFGNILSCKVVVDPATGESKGYAYIHYDTVDAASAAIAATSGQLLGGKGSPLVVTHFARKSDRSGQSFTNVFVKNLDESVTQQQLDQLFSKFGNVTSSFLATGEDGKSKGFGFVNYDEPEAAQKAIDELNDKEIAGKKIYVGRAQTKKERESVLRNERDKKRSERMHRFQGLNLYVKNLDDTIDDEKLKEFFSQFGSITSAKVMRDEKNVSRGFGFVCFSTPEEAQKALNEHNKSFGSKPIFVAMHQPKDQRKSFLEQLYNTRGATGAQRMFPQPGVYPPMAYPYPGPVPGGRPVPGQYPYPPMMGRQGPNPQWRGPAGPGGPRPQMGGPYPPQAGQPTGFPPGQRGPRQPRQGGPGQQRVGAPAAGQPGQPPRQQTQANFQFKAGVRNAGPTSQPQPEQMPVQQVAQPVLQANEPLTPAALLAAEPAQQKQILGERLFPLVSRHQPELGPKITGMLLQMDNSEVLHLIESPDALHESIKEALAVLQSAGYGADQ